MIIILLLLMALIVNLAFVFKEKERKSNGK